MESKTKKTETQWLLIFAGIVTVAFAFALSRGWEPGIPEEWVWRRNSLPVHMLAPFAAGLILATHASLLCRNWETMSPRTRKLGLAALVLVVFVFQIGALNAIGTPWITPGAYVVSPNVTTYFAVSLEVRNTTAWLANYAEQLTSLPHHAATHPPGFVLFFLGLRKACARLIPSTDWFQQVAEGYELFGVALSPTDAAAAIIGALLLALFGALGLAPIYLLARRLTNEQAAICATCSTAAMPGILLLGASPDLFIMSLATLSLSLAYFAWHDRPWLGALAGLCLALGLFCSLGFALVVGWIAIWFCLGLFNKRIRGMIARTLLVGLFALIGFSVFYLILFIAFDYRPLAVARAALSAHRAMAATEGVRTYWKWVLMNPVECLIFTGLPLSVAALWSWRALLQSEHTRLRIFICSWLALAFLLDLSGIVRGEVGRIWLFLMWPAALTASACLHTDEKRLRLMPLLLLLQVIQAIMMKGYLTIYSIL